MTDLRRLFMALTVTCSISMVPGQLLASRKATDLMSMALKDRAAGKLSEAISSFEYASEQADSGIQKNLARFMLGDCQLEAGRFADAATTFSALSESVTTSEEKAEALFRLMQAYSGQGNSSRAKTVFSQIQRDHRSSPYFELARSFMSTDGFKEAAVEETPVRVSAARQTAEPATLTVDPEPVPAAVENTEVLPDEYSEAEPEKISPVARPLTGKQAQPEIVAATTDDDEKVDEEVKLESQPVKKTETARKASPEIPAQAAQPSTIKAAGSGLKKTSAETSALLRDLLHVEMASGTEKDELVSKILGFQDALKDGPEKAGMDQTLLDLAETTARFGELLESCKTYDKILTHHPASPLVEKAYFQAIRMRAILGVHEAVVGWAKAFLAAFPASEYRSQVRALVEYSQADGKLDISGGGKSAVAGKVSKAPSQKGAGKDIVAENAALAADSQYVVASKKMKDGKYNLALVDFNRLAKKYPDAPQIWWDAALVQVQLEDFKKAAQAINKMLELDPGNEDANSLSGYIHYRLENFEEAASAYDQAGEPDGRGVNFFDAKTASERMKKSASKKQ